MNIREIQTRDNVQIEQVIRFCLKEFGGDRPGLAWEDPFLGCLSEVYQGDHSQYWVIEQDGRILGGCGIGPVENLHGICELQKMYCLPEVRGTGIAHRLMEIALEFAKVHYKQCYIETLSNMKAAQRFYQKYEFVALDRPLADTGHYSCDVWYLRQF